MISRGAALFRLRERGKPRALPQMAAGREQ